MIAPVVAGAIIYYSLRRTHTRLADLGNWASFAAFVLWTVAIRTHFIHFNSRTLPIVIAAGGVLMAIAAVWSVRRPSAPLAD